MGEVCLSRYKLLIVSIIVTLIGIGIAVPTLTTAIINKGDYIEETCKKNAWIINFLFLLVLV